MWKDKYRKLMFSVESFESSIQEAYKIKFKHIPLLYKYRAINDYSIDNLFNDTTWFNRASEFNDPYDSGLTMNRELMIDDKIKHDLINKFCKKAKLEINSVSKMLESLDSKQTLYLFLYYYSNLKNNPKEIPKIIEEYYDDLYKIQSEYQLKMNKLYQQSIFISCFSEKKDSILMWSHYASNHTGICIEYDFKQCGSDHFLTKNLHPVIYSPKIFDFTAYKESENRINVTTNASLTKSEIWSYENEWRLIQILNSDSEPFNGKIITPKTVFLGTNISKKDKEKIIKIANKKNILIKQMHHSDTEYKLYSD